MIQADQTHKNALFYLAFTVPANLAEKIKNSSFYFLFFCCHGSKVFET